MMEYTKMSASSKDINDRAIRRKAGLPPDKEIVRLPPKKKGNKFINFLKKLFKKKK